MTENKSTFDENEDHLPKFICTFCGLTNHYNRNEHHQTLLEQFPLSNDPSNSNDSTDCQPRALLQPPHLPSAPTQTRNKTKLQSDHSTSLNAPSQISSSTAFAKNLPHIITTTIITITSIFILKRKKNNSQLRIVVSDPPPSWLTIPSEWLTIPSEWLTIPSEWLTIPSMTVVVVRWFSGAYSADHINERDPNLDELQSLPTLYFPPTPQPSHPLAFPLIPNPSTFPSPLKPMQLIHLVVYNRTQCSRIKRNLAEYFLASNKGVYELIFRILMQNLIVHFEHKGSSGIKTAENGDFSTAENGDFSTAENGDFSAAENGDFSTAENGDFSTAENGDFSTAENGDFSTAENGDFRNAENGDFSNAENGDFSTAEMDKTSLILAHVGRKGEGEMWRGEKRGGGKRAKKGKREEKIRERKRREKREERKERILGRERGREETRKRRERGEGERGKRKESGRNEREEKGRKGKTREMGWKGGKEEGKEKKEEKEKINRERIQGGSLQVVSHV
ncbi:hypothetical protein FHG87_023965 [Trinorchestia longiramus]|nr:hypothetical protein FHG87_023965 [Trinorchestia longiramus]